MHKTFSHKGYVIDKEKLDKDKIKKLKDELTVTPTINKEFTDASKEDLSSYEVFTEDKKYLYIPRYFGTSKFGKLDLNSKKITFKDQKSKMKFTGKLRAYQEPIIKSCLESLKTLGGGIISLYCGAGKTTLALYLACTLGLKTLVVVHKSFLQDQWYERIKQFTDAKIGIIRQKKVDVKDKDIVIGMLQSISMRDYDPKIFQDYSIVIFDECHHTGSRVYSKALQKTTTKYTIGLSATPKRSDGTTKVINWFLGDVIYKLERKGDKNVAVKCFSYDTSSKLFAEKNRWFQGKTRPDTVKMRTNLCKIKSRNTFVVSIIDSLRKKYERKILVLAERREHLKTLKTKLDEIIQQEVDKDILEPGEVKTAYYMGKMKSYELEDAAEADIIFGTYAMAEEGLDIDRLNTLVLAAPKKDIVQSIGRIMRKPIKEGDIIPLIVDIVDDLSTFPNWAKVRTAFYNKNKYTVSNYMSYEDECISMKQYLVNKGVITNKMLKKDKDLDIEKEYICYKHGKDHYDFIQEFKDSDDDKEEEDGDNSKEKESDYNYNPNLDNIFDVKLEVVNDEEGTKN